MAIYFSHLKEQIVTKITRFSPLQHTYCKAKQFRNDIWEQSGEKGTWTGEQEIRERGKLRGDELNNQVLQECNNQDL